MVKNISFLQNKVAEVERLQIFQNSCIAGGSEPRIRVGEFKSLLSILIDRY